MSNVPTYGKLRDMLEELCKANDGIHGKLHPLIQELNEHIREPNQEVQNWPEIEKAMLDLLKTMEIVVRAHLQISKGGCTQPLEAK